MKTFLFEQYGYYPEIMEGDFFCVNDWMFKLIKVELEDELLERIDKYLVLIRDAFVGDGAFFIKNRSGKISSYYDGCKYVLISSKKRKINLNDITVFHNAFFEKEKTVDLKNLLNTWKENVNYIETYCLQSLRLDSVYYKDNFEISLYGLGLAQNSLQYLSDCIDMYGPELSGLSLTHKRMDSWDSFAFFNPFNFVIDHPVRDFSELYKNNCIDYSEMSSMLERYGLNEKQATILMARLLYPCKIFDLLECNLNNKNANLKINYSIEKEFVKLKKIYLFLRKRYKIRPIIWLE